MARRHYGDAVAGHRRGRRPDGVWRERVFWHERGDFAGFFGTSGNFHPIDFACAIGMRFLRERVAALKTIEIRFVLRDFARKIEP